MPTEKFWDLADIVLPVQPLSGYTLQMELHIELHVASWAIEHLKDLGAEVDNVSTFSHWSNSTVI